MIDYKELKNKLDTDSVALVAVSKTKPVESISELYDKGQRVFGENRVSELVEKYNALPKDIQWHMIGHLQSKKVKAIVPFIALIHSVDSIKLLKKIDREAKDIDREVNVLLQFHIADEESKYGFSESDIGNIEVALNDTTHIQIKGVMGMATFTNDERKVRGEFASLIRIHHQLMDQHIIRESDSIISMGMSGDYKLAIEQGSNMVRIGSLIFGSRT